MPIVSSSFALDVHTQVDGRRYVTETHTLNEGGPIVISYLAEAGTDYQAVLDARVPVLDAVLADEEAAGLMGA